MAAKFNVGDKFGSFEELRQLVLLYQKQQSVQLYVRDSRTIAAAVKRDTKKNFKTELKYSEITYSCIHGGKRYKSTSTGKRPHQFTFKKDCPCELRLRASSDGNHLIVKSVNESHNHEVSPVAFNHLPQQRKLHGSDKEQAKTMLSLNVNKKLLQQHLSNQSGHIVTLKDIHNVATSHKFHSATSDVTIAIEELKKVQGSVVEVVVTEENVFSALFFQDKKMQHMYSCFPEILFVDATHKLNDLRMPLYLLIVEDGNGESEVVGFWIVLNEDTVSITKMVSLFKQHNECWTKTVIIMSDKDFVERDVFKQEYPQATLHICLFHVLRTFRREVTCDKLGVTQAERILILEIIQKMAYAQSKEYYFELYEQLKVTNLRSVLEYFDTNWHCIRNEWVNCFKNDHTSFLNRTNNRVESINQKVKSVMSRYSNLHQFFTELLKVLSSLRIERDHKIITLFQKVPVSPFSEDSVQHKFMNLLTPYALSYVVQQIDLASKVNLVIKDDGSFAAESYSVTSDSCTCSFWKSMQLPCRHIFASLIKCDKPLYCPSLCSLRWTQQYYKSSHQVFAVNVPVDESQEFCTTVLSHKTTKNILSQHEKYRKAYYISQKLASLISETSMREFQQKLFTLEEIIEIWESGGRCVIQACDELDEGKDSGMFDQIEVDLAPFEEESSYIQGNMGTEKEVLSDITETVQQTSVVAQLNQSVTTDIGQSSSNLANNEIKCPPKLPKRGRPKGNQVTVVGLPRKKKLKIDKPTAFIKKHPKDQEKIILKWLLSHEDVQKALNGDLIDEDRIETRPELIPTQTIDENVNILRIRKYFTDDGWGSLMEALQEKRSSSRYFCKVCSCELEDCTVIACDCCLEWSHLACVGLKSAPKRKEWFCRQCHVSV